MAKIFLILLASGLALAADPALIEKGKQVEAKTCTPCHGLRIIHVQRLPRGAWERELDKMARWGWKPEERPAVLEYLVANFGDDKPLPELPRTAPSK